MAKLLLGPILRHVSETTASVWVETDRPCQVEILHGSAATFTVHGHHFAIVDLDGLTPGTALPYTVSLDGEVASADVTRPSPVIKTREPGSRASVLFGSCRVMAPDDTPKLGPDMLVQTSRALATREIEAPDALLLIGDQVYSDKPPKEVREFIRSRRDPKDEPGEEANDFDEYAQLYRAAWSQPDVAWLLSTVPTYMMFDDHDLRDDWNTSAGWREAIRAKPWWQGRVRSGLGAYWVYQHAGNLSAAERVDDPVCRAIAAADGDAQDVLDAMADKVDEDPDSYRWSYTLDIGNTRVVMLDARCGRVLTPGARRMTTPTQAEWLTERINQAADHVLIASSLPVLLPPVLHYAESWSEVIADGEWGKRPARTVERLRRLIDLEHWPAFSASLDELIRVVSAAVERPDGPSSVLFLSGDIHYSYLASVPARPGVGRVHQLVCSPLRNPLSGKIKRANQVASWRGLGPFAWAFAAMAGVHRRLWRWRVAGGPWFDNAIARIDLDGAKADARWYRAESSRLDEMAHHSLTE